MRETSREREKDSSEGEDIERGIVRKKMTKVAGPLKKLPLRS